MNAKGGKRKRETSISYADLPAHHGSDGAIGSMWSETSASAFMLMVVNKISCMASAPPLTPARTCPVAIVPKPVLANRDTSR